MAQGRTHMSPTTLYVLGHIGRAEYLRQLAEGNKE